jgi:hypothetical protein
MSGSENALSWRQVWGFLWSRKELIGFFFGLLIGSVSVCLWFDARISNAAREAVLREEFLTRLAKVVRPTCLFDSHGTIEADLGTSDYVRDIRVVLQPSDFGMDVEVDCKRHLAYAPLVTCLSSGISAVDVIRTPPNGWKYSMRPASTFTSIAAESGMNTNDIWRFKLEILH